MSDLPPGVTIRQVPFGDIVNRVDPGEEKPVVYEFSNGRKFVDPEENGGPYDQPS